MGDGDAPDTWRTNHVRTGGRGRVQQWPPPKDTTEPTSTNGSQSTPSVSSMASMFGARVVRRLPTGKVASAPTPAPEPSQRGAPALVASRAKAFARGSLPSGGVIAEDDEDDDSTFRPHKHSKPPTPKDGNTLHRYHASAQKTQREEVVLDGTSVNSRGRRQSNVPHRTVLESTAEGLREEDDEALEDDGVDASSERQQQQQQQVHILPGVHAHGRRVQSRSNLAQLRREVCKARMRLRVRLTRRATALPANASPHSPLPSPHIHTHRPSRARCGRDAHTRACVFVCVCVAQEADGATVAAAPAPDTHVPPVATDEAQDARSTEDEATQGWLSARINDAERMLGVDLDMDGDVGKAGHGEHGSLFSSLFNGAAEAVRRASTFVGDGNAEDTEVAPDAQRVTNGSDMDNNSRKSELLGPQSTFRARRNSGVAEEGKLVTTFSRPPVQSSTSGGSTFRQMKAAVAQIREEEALGGGGSGESTFRGMAARRRAVMRQSIGLSGQGNSEVLINTITPVGARPPATTLPSPSPPPPPARPRTPVADAPQDVAATTPAAETPAAAPAAAPPRPRMPSLTTSDSRGSLVAPLEMSRLSRVSHLDAIDNAVMDEERATKLFGLLSARIHESVQGELTPKSARPDGGALSSRGGLRSGRRSGWTDRPPSARLKRSSSFTRVSTARGALQRSGEATPDRGPLGSATQRAYTSRLAARRGSMSARTVREVAALSPQRRRRDVDDERLALKDAPPVFGRKRSVVHSTSAQMLSSSAHGPSSPRSQLKLRRQRKNSVRLPPGAFSVRPGSSSSGSSSSGSSRTVDFADDAPLLQAGDSPYVDTDAATAVAVVTAGASTGGGSNRTDVSCCRVLEEHLAQPRVADLSSVSVLPSSLCAFGRSHRPACVPPPLSQVDEGSSENGSSAVRSIRAGAAEAQAPSADAAETAHDPLKDAVDHMDSADFSEFEDDSATRDACRTAAPSAAPHAYGTITPRGTQVERVEVGDGDGDGASVTSESSEVHRSRVALDMLQTGSVSSPECLPRTVSGKIDTSLHQRSRRTFQGAVFAEDLLDCGEDDLASYRQRPRAPTDAVIGVHDADGGVASASEANDDADAAAKRRSVAGDRLRKSITQVAQIVSLSDLKTLDRSVDQCLPPPARPPPPSAFGIVDRNQELYVAISGSPVVRTTDPSIVGHASTASSVPAHVANARQPGRRKPGSKSSKAARPRRPRHEDDGDSPRSAAKARREPIRPRAMAPSREEGACGAPSTTMATTTTAEETSSALSSQTIHAAASSDMLRRLFWSQQQQPHQQATASNGAASNDNARVLHAFLSTLSEHVASLPPPDGPSSGLDVHDLANRLMQSNYRVTPPAHGAVAFAQPDGAASPASSTTVAAPPDVVVGRVVDESSRRLDRAPSGATDILMNHGSDATGARHGNGMPGGHYGGGEGGSQPEGTTSAFQVGLYIDDIEDAVPGILVWRFKKGVYLRLSDREPRFQAVRGFYAETNCACTNTPRPYYGFNVAKLHAVCVSKEPVFSPLPEGAHGRQMHDVVYRIHYDNRGVVRSVFDVTVTVAGDPSVDTVLLVGARMRLKGQQHVVGERSFAALALQNPTDGPTMMMTPQLFRNISCPTMSFRFSTKHKTMARITWTSLGHVCDKDWIQYQRIRTHFVAEYRRSLEQLSDNIH